MKNTGYLIKFILAILVALLATHAIAGGLSDKEKRKLDEFAKTATPDELRKDFNGRLKNTIKLELDKIFGKDPAIQANLNLQPCFLEVVTTAQNNKPLSVNQMLIMADKYELENLHNRASTLYKLAYDQAIAQNPPLLELAVAAKHGSARMASEQYSIFTSQTEFQQALTLSDEVHGHNSQQSIYILMDIANNIKNHLGGIWQAESYYLDAYQRLTKITKKTNHLEIKIILNLLDIYFYSNHKRKYKNTKFKALRLADQYRQPSDFESISIAIRLNFHFKTTKNERAELFKKALYASEKKYGPDNAAVQNIRSLFAVTLYSAGNKKKAAKILEEVETYSFIRSTTILQHSQKDGELRDSLQDARGFQNIAISMALENPSLFTEIAARAILNGKYISEERSSLITRSSYEKSVNESSICAPRLIKYLRNRIFNYINASGSRPDIIETQAIKIAINELERLEQRLLDSLTKNEILQFQKGSITKKTPLKLKNNTALIEYAQFSEVDFFLNQPGKPKLVAMVMKGKTQQIFDLGDFQSLYQAWKAFEKTPSKKNSYILYAKLIEPLESTLSNSANIFIAPDGFLNLFDIGRLVDKNNKYLIESKNIRYVRTGRHLVGKKIPIKSPQSDKMIIYGNINYDTIGTKYYKGPVRFEKLNSGFQNELAGISQAYEMHYSVYPELRLDSNATEYSLKNEIDSPHILHIITHGFNNSSLILEKSRPLFLSGIALAGANKGIRGGWGKDGEDGVLSAEEAQDLSLDHTVLAVLSACNTGLGNVSFTEGIYGMSRSFLIAGADNVLVSMSKIYDNDAATFISAFYKNWLGGKKNITPSDALRKTKLMHINNRDPRYRDPAIWAPYIIIEQGGG